MSHIKLGHLIWPISFIVSLIISLWSACRRHRRGRTVKLLTTGATTRSAISIPPCQKLQIALPGRGPRISPATDAAISLFVLLLSLSMLCKLSICAKCGIIHVRRVTDHAHWVTSPTLLQIACQSRRCYATMVTNRTVAHGHRVQSIVVTDGGRGGWKFRARALPELTTIELLRIELVNRADNNWGGETTIELITIEIALQARATTYICTFLNHC